MFNHYKNDEGEEELYLRLQTRKRMYVDICIYINAHTNITGITDITDNIYMLNGEPIPRPPEGRTCAGEGALVRAALRRCAMEDRGQALVRAVERRRRRRFLTRLASKRHSKLPVGWRQSQDCSVGWRC